MVVHACDSRSREAETSRASGVDGLACGGALGHRETLFKERGEGE